MALDFTINQNGNKIRAKDGSFVNCIGHRADASRCVQKNIIDGASIEANKSLFYL
jgi:hypothetical protein